MIFYKGKKVLEMVDTHYEAVVNSFRHFSQFMTEYLENGAGETAEELRRQIDLEEKQADSTRHAVVREFLNGGLLAQTRAELLRVVDSKKEIHNIKTGTFIKVLSADKQEIQIRELDDDGDDESEFKDELSQGLSLEAFADEDNEADTFDFDDLELGGDLFDDDF